MNGPFQSWKMEIIDSVQLAKNWFSSLFLSGFDKLWTELDTELKLQQLNVNVNLCPSFVNVNSWKKQ